MRKTTLLFLCFLFLANLNAEINVVLEKNFAVTNEFFSLIATSEEISENTMLYLNVRDNKGKSILNIPSMLQDEKAMFRINIPANLQTDWYHFTVYTLSENNQDIIDYFQIGIPVYNDNDSFTSQNASKISTFSFLSCSVREEAMVAYLNSESVIRINQSIENPTKSGKLSSSTILSSAHEILFELATKDTGKSFYAFLNTESKKVQGLRKVDGQIYSLSSDVLSHSIVGQVLSLEASGEVKIIPAKIVSRVLELPAIINVRQDILQNDLIAEYIIRHRQRLKIQSLYEQTYFQSGLVNPSSTAGLIYKTSDYIQFNSTEEFINEVLQVVKYNNRKKSFSILNEEKVWNKANPLVLIDGRAVEPEKVLSMIDYKDLESIEIYRLKTNLRESFSSFGRAGVLSFNTSSAKNDDQLLQWNDYNKVNVAFDPSDGPVFMESYLQDKKTSNVIQTENYYLRLLDSGKTCKVDIEKAN